MKRLDERIRLLGYEAEVRYGIRRRPELHPVRRLHPRHAGAGRDVENDDAGPLSLAEKSRVARGVWRDAGAACPDRIRTFFLRLAQAIGWPEATCLKCWRHSFSSVAQRNTDRILPSRLLIVFRQSFESSMAFRIILKAVAPNLAAGLCP